MALGAAAPAALAQGDNSLRIIVPYAPGGSSDRVARIVGDKLGARLGVPVVVENKTGANATIAGTEVVRAKPDGLTLWYAASPTIT
ncbi:MAG: tripartite tricarboxylate transporter substrate binding protein, partial [Proteobacteria bacterium]|nr:tripartite tricarboxylate transporter substrate binding protein [Pseudomonadota bacterium]